VCSVKVTPDLGGSLGETFCTCTILKDTTANHVSLENLINEDFGKIHTAGYLYSFRGNSTQKVQNDCASFDQINSQGIKMKTH